MTDTFRAMCAELSELDGHCVVDCTEEWADAMCRLRALLAQPVAEGPTDEELLDLADDSDLERSYPDGTVIKEGCWEAWDRQLLAFARAALARWGRPAPVPVAIPGEKYHEDMGPVTWWRLPVDEPPWVGTPNDSDWPGYHTHFTPAPTNPLNAHALPTPRGRQ